MKIKFDNSHSVSAKDTIVLFTHPGFEFKNLPTKLYFIRTYGTESYFRDLKNSLYLPADKEANLVVVPVKNGGDIDDDIIRSAAAQAVRCAGAQGVEKIKVALPIIDGYGIERMAQLLTEGIVIGGYCFDKYKTDDSESSLTVTESVLLGLEKGAQELVLRTALVSENTNLCRTMVNSGTEEINPDSIEKEAKLISKHKNISLSVLNEKKLLSKKMNLICAVGRAGRYRPRILELKYKGGSSSKGWTALVGKGVTFDTGGLDIKNAAGMLDMRYDMAGAATVLYTIKSIAELNLPVNVYAVIPLVENSVDSESYKPGDVFVSYSGKSVHVQNTDAEGRLILADAIAYAEKDLKADRIIDVATLTGACSITFGDHYAALITEDNTLNDDLTGSAEYTGEKIWRLPMNRAYEKMIKSDFADLMNVAGERKAGTIVGAAFLKQFVNKSRWAHIDIASTAWSDSAGSLYGKYSTGFGVRLLTAFLSEEWRADKE
ncbi:MAG: leucyl aminopeptidase family protein [Spirochaetes bacterium]|nr:leucyl aminopeptidase family protein [Spirochaetota bacterium]